MADENPTPDSSSATEPNDQQQPEVKPAADNLPPEVKAALRKANKEAETLRLKLKELEDKDKSEAEKLVERLATAERERDALRTEAVRARVALTKGLPPELADRLRGDTEDEMAADADALLALVPAVTSRPRGDVDQGVRTTALPLNGDPLLNDLKSRLGIT